MTGIRLACIAIVSADLPPLPRLVTRPTIAAIGPAVTLAAGSVQGGGLRGLRIIRAGGLGIQNWLFGVARHPIKVVRRM